jgi:hypothetical protein
VNRTILEANEIVRGIFGIHRNNAIQVDQCFGLSRHIEQGGV